MVGYTFKEEWLIYIYRFFFCWFESSTRTISLILFYFIAASAFSILDYYFFIENFVFCISMHLSFRSLHIVFFFHCNRNSLLDFFDIRFCLIKDDWSKEDENEHTNKWMNEWMNKRTLLISNLDEEISSYFQYTFETVKKETWLINSNTAGRSTIFKNISFLKR